MRIEPDVAAQMVNEYTRQSKWLAVEHTAYTQMAENHEQRAWFTLVTTIELENILKTCLAC